MTPTRPASLPPLQRLWLTEAVRLREAQGGPLEDAQANRLARAAGGDLAERLQRRALFLAERDGQLAALRHWLQGARLALAALLALGVLSGVGLAASALGDGSRPVNVFWALGSLLGLDLLTLLGWLLGLACARGDGLLGRLWLWLSARLARDAGALTLAPALLRLLERRRLARWGLGVLVHGCWALLMLTAVLGLLALLATRRYDFVWETTLLDGDSVVLLTRLLGALPALLGFALPDPATVRASGGTALDLETARQAWAAWLVGVTLTYGLLPRVLLALFCLVRWRHGRQRLSVDLEDPLYQLLRRRLQPDSERLGVVDPAPALPSTARVASGAEGNGAWLVGIELVDHPWPPALPAGVSDAGVLDSGEQRRRLLERFSAAPPARLLIACDPRRSPDRGTLALLAELAQCAAGARVWLLPPPAGESLDAERLDDWRQALDRAGLTVADAAPLQWLEEGR